MTEIRALRKHPCPECGGDAEWNAAKRALACPYCGCVVPWAPDAAEGEPSGQGSADGSGGQWHGGGYSKEEGSAALERDLAGALAQFAVKGKGLQNESRSVRCESCQAITLFQGERAAQRCDFCGSPAIASVEGGEEVITPESLLPAVVAEAQVRTDLRKWYGSRWFAPNKLKGAALTDTLKGIYLPYWTFDAHAHANWEAQAGYHYYVSESYTDSQGRSQTRQVQRTRWEWTSGELEHFFDDDAVPASVGVHLALLRKVEPFPTTTELRPYDPAYVRGWAVERYQVDLHEAEATNRKQMEQELYRLCGSQVPGDTHRSLTVEAEYADRTFKHILVPVWLVSYTYGRKSFQVVVNGYTGTIAGERPYSWVKIFFAVVFGLIGLLVAYWLLEG